MTISMKNADTYRELRVYVKPDNLHGAIDEMLGVLGAWSVKIEPLYEANFPEDFPDEGPIPDKPVFEYILTGMFDADDDHERGNERSDD